METFKPANINVVLLPALPCHTSYDALQLPQGKGDTMCLHLKGNICALFIRLGISRWGNSGRMFGIEGSNSKHARYGCMTRSMS
jgi:hypothetical protein